MMNECVSTIAGGVALHGDERNGVKGYLSMLQKPTFVCQTYIHSYTFFVLYRIG